MRSVFVSLFGVSLLAGVAVARPPGPPPSAAAPAGPGRFAGAHPIAPPASGFCYIDVPHTHSYAAPHSALFQETTQGAVFSGDPVPFGYEGDKTVYYGHHPIPVIVDGPPGPGSRFCFLKGPHYHEYPAPPGPGFKVKDSVVFYVGPIQPEVAAARPQLERAIEVEYRPYVALRPQVVVTPPPEWQGVVWVAPAVIPPPPPVVVAAPPRPVVVAPAPPAVIVAPPGPPAVIIAPAPPPPVIIAPHHHGKWKGKWKGKGKHGFGWKHW